MDKRGRILITVGCLLLASALCLWIHRLWEERQAEAAAAEVLQQLELTIEQPEAEQESLVLKRDCIGVLTIPSLELELPVFAACTDALLQAAPCRYTGAADTGDLVIAGHNYDSHFGSIHTLVQNAEVRFTDLAGQTFTYQVKKREILAAAAVEEMTVSPWALTLFTCTYGGADRIAVRCEQVA